MEIYQFACLSDNYGYLLHDAATNATACVDTPDFEAIDKALSDKGWTLTHILNTHHHPDHVGANLALKKKYRCIIVGPRAESDRIPGIDVAVSEGDVVQVGDSCGVVYDTPGHTLGHIVYHFTGEKAAFVGDVIFPMGCGRLFEGTAAQAWHSLEKVRQWPSDTLLYCAHEYTEANARFALTIEPQNVALQKRYQQTLESRQHGLFTVPSLLQSELDTNPFLRTESAEIRRAISVQDTDSANVFSKIRSLKDHF
jgi:hydroxyacylglutathione hydrolase